MAFALKRLHHGVLHGVPGAAGGAVKGGDEQGGVVHHVAVPPLHAVGRVFGGDQGLEIAGLHQARVPLPLVRGPGVRLGGAGHGGLHRNVRVLVPESQHGLAEIEVAAQGHAAEKVAVALLIGGFRRVGNAPFQGQAAGVRLPVAPGQLLGAVAGEAAADLSGAHGGLLPPAE